MIQWLGASGLTDFMPTVLLSLFTFLRLPAHCAFELFYSLLSMLKCWGEHSSLSYTFYIATECNFLSEKNCEGVKIKLFICFVFVLSLVDLLIRSI